LAQRGFHTVLIARRIERLESLASTIALEGGQAAVIQADLTQENERIEAYSRIAKMDKPVEVLVNNAGIGWYGFTSHMPWQTAKDLLQVNIAAMVHFTLLTLNQMLERKTGFIINVGSISGSLPSQGVSVYGASKSFMDNFTTALHREVHPMGVHACVVRAGPVRTEFGSQAANRPHGFHLPTEHIGVSAETVAKAIIGLIHKPRRYIYVPGWLALTPLIENCFGWVIDRLGPLLLNRYRI
jgi:hypothetical protein